MVFAGSHSIVVSRLRRPFLSDRYFFITVRLLRQRANLTDRTHNWKSHTPQKRRSALTTAPAL
ncbi:MAG: hypothetical protein DMG22_10530 [Acidobacteria bacterium]|nr:MAG: hypothetical protein DMG22_10530 [Acidobacteriota bacterium]